MVPNKGYLENKKTDNAKFTIVKLYFMQYLQREYDIWIYLIKNKEYRYHKGKLYLEGKEEDGQTRVGV